MSVPVRQVMLDLPDTGSYQTLDDAPPLWDPLGFPGYAGQVRNLRAGDGPDESVTTGTCRFDGAEVVLAVGSFTYLGGSMGAVHGDRIVRAMEYAACHRLPLVTVAASGGARMQEGPVSLLQMVRTAEGSRRLREQGVPHLTLLCSPTTGGVFASYVSLADVALAETGAVVGFAGPRVVEAFTGVSPDGSSHTAETARSSGLVDGVVSPSDARSALITLTHLLHPRLRSGSLPSTQLPPEPSSSVGGLEAVHRSRRPERPTGEAVVAQVFDTWMPLHGDRTGSDDPHILVGIGRIGARTCAYVAQDHKPGGAGGYRKAVRLLDLARRLDLPVVTFVDTPGADPSPASENAGIAHWIAETMVALLAVEAPTVAVISGEGGSGGAMALLGCDRVIMQEDAALSVIAPEAAAVILYRDAGRVSQLAGHLGLSAATVRDLGIADRVIPGPTVTTTASAARAMRDAVVATLRELEAMPDRVVRRGLRYGAGGASDVASFS